MPSENEEAPNERPQRKTRRLLRSRKKGLPVPPRRGLAVFFLRGLVTLAPILLTLVVFGLVYQMVDRYVTGPINSAIYWSLEGNSLGWKALRRLEIEPYDISYLDTEHLPAELKDVSRSGFTSDEFENALSIYRAGHDSFFKDLEEQCVSPKKLRDDVKLVVHPLIGVLLSLLLVLWMGWLVGGFLGRRVVGNLDQMMHKIPVVKSVYPYSKQLVEFFFAEKQIEFDTVVAIPYPSKGLWSLGFITGPGLTTLREETGERLVSVFIPSSPMPMTGYTVFLPYELVVPLPITVDEALRITMTGGVLVPPNERVDDPLLDDLEQALPDLDALPVDLRAALGQPKSEARQREGEAS